MALRGRAKPVAAGACARRRSSHDPHL